MEQPVPVPTDVLIRPWRTATLVATAVAAVELVLIVVLGVALVGKPLSEKMRNTAQERSTGITAPIATKKPRIGSPVARLSREETTVLVLNGNGVTGAAHEAAARVQSRGYSVGHVGNASRSDYRRSIVLYRPGYRGEALRLAKDLRIKIAGPLDGLNVRQMMGAHVAVIIG